MDNAFKKIFWIDWLNVLLIAVSLIFAVFMPFKLFLMAYAFLGPLHYLTEINWLRQKNYFIQSDFPIAKVFGVIALLLSLYPVYLLIESIHSSTLDTFLRMISDNGKVLILTAFFTSIGTLFAQKVKDYVILICFAFLMAFTLIFLFPQLFITIGLFLPTILHVFLFTGLFMLYGSKKSKSRVGYLASVLLFVMPLIIYFIPIDPADYQVSDSLLATYNSSNIYGVSKAIASIIGVEEADRLNIISQIGLKIHIFISFAYTYHYLNWFSKTSIIGWKESLNMKKTAWIVFIWLFSVMLYLNDYRLGFTALFFLSFLHVFLEFPLNVRTIQSLFKNT